MEGGREGERERGEGGGRLIGMVVFSMFEFLLIALR